MTTELIPNADMQVFPPADIARARLILNQPALDEASAIKALIIQHDTGLSMARGEISIVPFNGRPQVMINRQGYLAYASRQSDYDGYESDVETIDGETVAWCKVYNKNRSHPVCVKIFQKEYAKSTAIWREKPRYMLEKTAISLALRAAFPILNGTYTEDEIEADAPVRIQQQPTDINVQPEPVTVKTEVKTEVPPATTGTTSSTSAAKPEPVKQPVKNYTCNTVTREEVNLRLIPAYQRQGFQLGVFADADLGNGKFDKDLIDADFRRQAGISAPAPTPAPSPTPAPAPEAHPADGLDKFTAESIAIAEENLKLKAEQEKALKNFVAATQKAEASKQTKPTPAPAATKTPAQTKPSATLSGDVCEVCGCKLLEYDIQTCRLFTPGHKFCEQHRNEYINSKAKGGSQ